MSLEQQEPNPDEAVKERIHRHAAAYAEAVVYSMNNAYLTREQKAFVEAVYQTPLGVFGYVLLGHLAFVEPRSYWVAFLVAAICNAVLAVPWWLGANTTIARVGFLFAGTVTTVMDLGFAAFFGYQGDWLAVGIAVASAFGLLTLIAPSTWIYNVLGRGLHPKYRIAKRLFGLEFPFERDLVRQNSATDIQFSKLGNQRKVSKSENGVSVGSRS